MAKRFTDTELWDKEWFMALKPRLKCLVKYVRDKCDLAGIWSPNWKLAEMYIGERVAEKDLVNIDGGRQFRILDDGKVFCIGFINFQYGEKLNPASPIHKKILAILEKQKIEIDKIDTLPNTLPDRVSGTLQEEEEDKEEDKVKEEEEVIIGPFGKNFQYWDGWKRYKLEEHREKYKSPKTEMAAMDHLFKLAHGDPETARQIIEQSIANRWKGLFELKNHGSTKNKQGATKEGLIAKLDERFAKQRQGSGDGYHEAV